MAKMLLLILITLLVLCGGGILFYLYMIARNEWVYKKRIEWNKKVYDARIAMLKSDNNDYGKYTYDELYNNLASYNDMMDKFWCYDLIKFISDADRYGLVQKYSQN